MKQLEGEKAELQEAMKVIAAKVAEKDYEINCISYAIQESDFDKEYNKL